MALDDHLDILIFAAHPDDAEVGCGGALILGSEKGLAVGIADLSRGEGSTRGNPDLRREETSQASQHLRLKVRLSLGLPDTRIGHDPAHGLALVKAIREYRPRIVLAPYWKDRHPDHAATGKLAREACFYAGVRSVGEGTTYRPDRLYHYMLHEPFRPSFVVDITSAWTGKLAAIQAYQSQFQAGVSGPATALSNPDFLNFIETRARYYGGLIGTTFGEPYFTKGPLALGFFPEATPARPNDLERLSPYRPYI
ncbi:MAG TPA: bacillithiol biosynthesis deacetylase BshB1 [Chloroflexia bacterium]|nr:bacillithiol biosynthesis deacetylase BshB1 [Chloroflexia bacterium]